ncbi:hypothetical protein IKQ21_04930 [bacterium]|nr:hypothetical protein [bacterium]
MLAVMQNKMSEEEINIRYSDLDFDKTLKPFSLLNFFQDIASDNAERLGFGYSFIYPQNLMWVLLKYRIEFNEYPSDIQSLVLRTEPRGCNKLFAYRNFELLSGNKTLAKASSVWSLVDFKTMSIVNAENVISGNPYMSKFVQQENDLKYNKIPQITEVHSSKEFEVRYNDIDVNRHANNGNYIVWALEPIELEFRKTHKLKTIDMVYKKEIKYGECLVSCVQNLEGNKTLHALKHKETGEDLCLICCEWVEYQ